MILWDRHHVLGLVPDFAVVRREGNVRILLISDHSGGLMHALLGELLIVRLGEHV